MNAFYAVFQRELAERRLLFLVGLAGLFPVVVPLLPGIANADLRVGLALVLCYVVSGVLAVLLGATIVAGDLAEGRLAFYFARPLPARAIWGGKMAAAFFLTASVAVLVLLPAWLVEPALRQVLSGDEIGLWAVAVLTILFLAHAASVALRSRSPWLLLDVAAAVVLGLALWAAGRSLYDAAPGAFELGAVFLAAVVLAVLPAASWLQVARGRTDPLRGHRVLSAVLWAVLAVATIGIAGYARFVLGAGPQDLDSIESVAPAPAGSWVLVGGPAANRARYWPSFLVDAATGRSIPLPRLLNGPLFSRDGRRAVWIAGDGRRLAPPYAMMSAELSPGHAAVAAPILLSSYPFTIALSPEGDRFAFVAGGRLVVEEVPGGRLLAAAPFSGTSSTSYLLFPDREHVRLYAGVPESWNSAEMTITTRIAELDLRSGRVEPTGTIRNGAVFAWDFSPSGDRLLWRGADRTSPIEVLDARSGARLATLPQPPRGSTRAAFLPDGGFLTARADHGDWELCHLTAEGREPACCPFPQTDLSLAGETGSGRMLLDLHRKGEPKGAARVLEVDLATCATRTLARGLAPLRSFGWPSSSIYGPESVGSRLFRTGAAGLAVLDPATGRVRPLLGS